MQICRMFADVCSDAPFKLFLTFSMKTLPTPDVKEDTQCCENFPHLSLGHFTAMTKWWASVRCFTREKIASCKNTVRKPVYVLMVEALNIYRWLFLADVQSQQQMISWVDDIKNDSVTTRNYFQNYPTHFLLNESSNKSKKWEFLPFFERRRGKTIKCLQNMQVRFSSLLKIFVFFFNHWRQSVMSAIFHDDNFCLHNTSISNSIKWNWTLLGCARFGEFRLFFTERVFHCNTMRKAIKAHKNLQTNQQNEHIPERSDWS